MKRILRTQVDRTLADGLKVRLLPAERNALLEIGCLAMVADGLLREDEMRSFADAVRLLIDPGVTDQDARALVERFIEENEWEEPDAILADLTSQLTCAFAREQAFKLASLIALSDFDTNPSEAQFTRKLSGQLGFSDSDRDRLTDEIVDSVAVAPFA